MAFDVHVEMPISRELRVRMALARWLIRLAAWALGASFAWTVHDSSEKETAE